MRLPAAQERMQKLLPYGVVVVAVAAAGFVAAFLFPRSSVSARPAPAVRVSKLPSVPAIQRLSADAAALPSGLAVVRRARVVHSAPTAVVHASPAPVFQAVPPATHYTPSARTSSSPPAHRTTTIIIQGGSG